MRGFGKVWCNYAPSIHSASQFWLIGDLNIDDHPDGLKLLIETNLNPQSFHFSWIPTFQSKNTLTSIKTHPKIQQILLLRQSINGSERKVDFGVREESKNEGEIESQAWDGVRKAVRIVHFECAENNKAKAETRHDDCGGGGGKRPFYVQLTLREKTFRDAKKSFRYARDDIIEKSKSDNFEKLSYLTTSKLFSCPPLEIIIPHQG